MSADEMTDKEAEEMFYTPGTMRMVAASEGETILKYFEFAHLAQPLQSTSMLFAALALALMRSTPRCAERTAALRKLLEAKDCAVRANLPETGPSVITPAPANAAPPSKDAS